MIAAGDVPLLEGFGGVQLAQMALASRVRCQKKPPSSS